MLGGGGEDERVAAAGKYCGWWVLARADGGEALLQASGRGWVLTGPTRGSCRIPHRSPHTLHSLAAAASPLSSHAPPRSLSSQAQLGSLGDAAVEQQLLQLIELIKASVQSALLQQVRSRCRVCAGGVRLAGG